MNTELYHHGIKGQKWGVRRFQTEDGDYTTLGKMRRRASDAENSAYGAASSAKKTVKALNDKLGKKANRSIGEEAAYKVTRSLTDFMKKPPSKLETKLHEFQDKVAEKWNNSKAGELERNIKEIGGKVKDAYDYAKPISKSEANAETSYKVKELAKQKVDEAKARAGVAKDKAKEFLSDSNAVRVTTKDAANMFKGASDLTNSISNLMNRNRGMEYSKARSMSDTQLRNSINRLRLEKEYVELTAKDTTPGLDFIRDVLSVAAPLTATVGATASIVNTVNKKFKEG